MRERGRFGKFGGFYVPEVLVPALEQIEEHWKLARKDPEFKRELNRLLKEYAGRPTPITWCENFSRKIG